MSVPGLGVRFEFDTRTGLRLGVFHRQGGRQELLIFDQHDPDTCRETIPLEDEDARTLAEILGGASVAHELSRLRHRIEGIAIDWLPLAADSPFVGRTIGDTGARTRTGVSIVAIVREDGAVPAPGPEQGLRQGDTLVVVGTPRGIEDLVVILRQG
jgi:TrkA domain protein